MDGLTGEEYGRFQKLQEIYPQDDPSGLFKTAAPFLKADEAFNFFLNKLIEGNLTVDDNEERRMNESLVLSSTSQMAHDDPIKGRKKKLISGPDEYLRKVRKLSDGSNSNNMETESNPVQKSVERRAEVSDVSLYEWNNPMVTLDLPSMEENSGEATLEGKNIKFSKTDSQSPPSTTRDADVYRIETSTTELAGNSTEETLNQEVSKNILEKKSETQDLEVPGYPFVYVVSESYSPAFKLPKGNYLITSTISSVDVLGRKFKVLHHPSNKEEKMSVFKRPFEPEYDSPKKSEGFITESPMPRKTFAKVRPFNLKESAPKRRKTFKEEKIFPSTSRQFLAEVNGNYALESGQNNNLRSKDDLPEQEIQELLEPQTNQKNDDEGADNPDYIRTELKNCGDDVRLEKQVIEKEIQRNRRSDIETQTIRNGWLKLIKSLPQLDPDYLLTKWTDIGCDDAAVDALIEEEKVKLQEEDIKKQLFTNLPFLDREYLDSKTKDFLSNPQVLEPFIEEEQNRMTMEEQLRNMVALLPGIDPVLLRRKCQEFQGNAALVEEFVQTKMYEEERNNQIASMQLILPDADPAFLALKYREFPGNDEAFNNFLFELLEKKDYPKIKKDDPAARERAESWRRFVDNFDVKDFLEKIPEPEEHYSSKGEDKTDIKFITKFLRFRYPNSSGQHLEKSFKKRGSNLTKACAHLDRRQQPVETMDVSFRNESIPESFLLEMVFILRQREIREHLRQEKELKDLKLAEARINNTFLTCSCCYEDELLENEVTACPEGHIVCVKCVTRYVQLKLGEGVTNFTCTTEDCGTEFILAILEKILPKNLYVKVLRKKQSAEVTEAGVSGLESCPSCDFAYIPTRDDKIFRCQNPDCMRETCRKCKENNHVPLRCEEVEKPKDTKVRTAIEEKMTEALLRTCYKCGKKFIRNQGCNVMTCVCGASMCYMCRKPLKRHGGCGCQHYSDTELHRREVRTAAQVAREQALRENPEVNLIHDPTKSV